MVNWGTPDSEKLLAEFLKFDEDPTEGIDHTSTSRRDIVALYTQNLTDFGHFSDNVFVNHYKEVVKKYQEQKAMRGGRVAAVAAAAIPVANSNNGGQGKRDHSIISSSVPPNGTSIVVYFVAVKD